MTPEEVTALVKEYDDLVKKIEISQRAVQYSKNTGISMEIKIKEKGMQPVFPINFNVELGQALYQAHLEELQNQLKEIKRRIAKWT
ncbi:hypothetical protein KAR91_52855 [Candidatus Pacearchaeota archaeon]|nr:hypothetical protein [Candidatus Pacearchaeota archaeon]